MSTAPAPKRRTKWLQVLIGLAVSFACLWWAAADMLKNPEDRERIGVAFRNADYRMLVPYLGALFVFYWLKAVRWKLLLTPVGQFRPMKDLFPPTMIGFAFNNLLPAHLGEFVRIFVFGRTHQLKKSSVLSTVVLERVFDVLAIVTFLGLGLLFVDGVSPKIKNLGIIGASLSGVLVLGALAFVIWTQPVLKVTETILRGVRIIPGSLVEKVLNLLRAAATGLSALNSPVQVFLILLTSLIQWGLNGWLMHLSLAAFGIEVSIWVACILLGAVAFAVTIPSTPGYFGVIQACFMEVLRLFTTDQETVFAASIFYHLAQYIPVTLLGLWYFNRTGLRMAQVQDAAESTPEPPAKVAVDTTGG